MSDLSLPLETASRGAPIPTSPGPAIAVDAGHCLFTSMIERFGDEIYRFACQLTGNGTDADDLYQETLLKAFRAYAKLPSDANHRAWLYRICSNTFISDRRKHGRVSPMNDVMAATLSDNTPDQARALDARDLLRDVERFVDTLPPKQRVALVLRKHHEYGYADIADVLNSSEAAARANVHEALTKLRGAFSHRMEV
ncbi:MAG: RNA polymerase sigma factor [Thermomicrobiales bacterium]